MDPNPWNSEDLAKQLYWASDNGDESEVLHLLKKGVNPNHENYWPLHWASKRNQQVIAKHLIKFGATIWRKDSRGGTALHWACANNSKECVKILVAHQAPTGIRNTKGKTAADLARERGHVEVAEYISSFKPLPRDSLSLYPSIRELIYEVQVNQWMKVGLHLNLSADHLMQLKNSDNPTVTMYLTAKKINMNLMWKDILRALLCSEEYELADQVYSTLDTVQPNDGASTVCTLNQVCVDGYFEIARYLVTKKIYDVKDSLLHAAKCDHLSEAEFLLTEYHADPNVTDEENCTPLALAKGFEVIKLLLKHGAKAENVYKAHSKHIGKLSSERPPENPLPIFITGDGGVGKSTFLKSMLSSKGIMSIFSKAKQVTGVDEKTVGIIPYEIVTKEFGRVVCYDFAGQQEFYASHCAVLENAAHTSPPIALYLADIQENDQKLVDSMVRWLTLVQNQCTNDQEKAHVIVIGSHADVIQEMAQSPWSKERLFAPILNKFPRLEFIAFIPMDCRYPDTVQMKKVKKLIQRSSAMLRSPETVSLNAHTFYIYLLDSFKGDLAVSLKDVQLRIHKDLDEIQSKRTQNFMSFIPSTLHRLVEICHQLSKRGLILYLHNDDNPERSFIICDQVTLLSKISGTVFAPDNFHQHCKLASSTGVVPLFKFALAFIDYDIEMLVAFMSHLELCFEITDEEVLKFVRLHDNDKESSSRYLFFPGLIRIDTPELIWEENSIMQCQFGWIIECSQEMDFFDPRCLQVLILRLVFTFNLAPAKKIQEHIPSIQRFCSVWKKGIFWCNDDGVISHLELLDNGKCIVLKMRSRTLKLEFLSLRGKIISKVLKAVKDFCPNVSIVESVVNIQEVVSLSPIQTFNACTINNIALAVIYSKECVKSEYKPHILSELLQFEPYVGLNYDTLQYIHSEKNTLKNEKISDTFISHFADQIFAFNMYCKIFNRTQSFKEGNDRHKLIQALTIWRDKTEGTYKFLRVTLDKYSLFTGRNLLDLAGVAHNECYTVEFPISSACEYSNQATQLVQVVEVIKEVSSDWYSLAVELNIKYKDRKAIEREHSSVEARCIAMLQFWVQRDSPLPSWAALIVKALRSRVISRNDIARRIENLTGAMTGESVINDESSEDTQLQGSLTMDKHLRMLRETLWDLRARWWNLGLQLGVHLGTLEMIEFDYQNKSSFCITHLLEHWLISNPLLMTLTDALTSPSINRVDIARNLDRLRQ